MRLLRVMVLLLLAACSRGATETSPKTPTPVRVRTVEKRTTNGGTRYSATVEPQTRVDLAFKVGGYVRDVAQAKGAGGDGGPRKIQEGDFVTKGTVLAAIRESDYEQRVASAKAAEAEAAAALKQAQLDHERATKLHASSSVSKAEVDLATVRMETAAARLEQAKSRVSEGQLALADCVLRAPMDGVVMKRGVEVGTLVAPGSLAFVLADTRSVKVVFGAPDTLVEKLKIGNPLTITLEAVQGELTGNITRIAPSADLKSRVFEVETTIANPQGHLKAGMIASLKVPDAVLQNDSLVLPLTAVVRSPRDKRGFSVFVVEGETARIRDVKLGDVIGNSVFVTSGVKMGESVISMGATLVNDGDAIRVIP